MARSRFTLPPTRLPRAVRFAQWLLLAGCVVFALSTLLRARPGHIELVDAWLYDLLTLLAAGLVAARGWLVSVERRAWLLLAAGMACSALGDVLYAALGADAPFPSIADASYLAFYPFTYAALLLLMRARLQKLTAAAWLDGVTAGLALAAVAAAAAFGPISAATGGSVAAVEVGLAYPLGDLLLLAVVAGALAVLGWRTEHRWGLLAAGFALSAVADTVYLFQTAKGSYLEGTWVDALWPASVLLVARAAWRPARKLSDRKLVGWSAFLPPLVCTVASLTVLVLDHDHRLPRLAVLLAACCLVVVAARLAVSFREVTALADSHEQAVTDELTGLANRRALLAGLNGAAVDWTPRAVAMRANDRAAAGLGPALLLIDLDRFKEINDSLGHHIGDELLRQVAARLTRAVRPPNLLARLGGDEFAVLLATGTGQAAARAIAERLVEALGAPFPLDDVTLHIEASVGIALCPLHCTDPAQLLQRADVAMYTAKRARGHVATYAAADDPHSRARIQTVEELRGALSRGELTCYYQPKVDSRDGAVRSVEALVRWEHPTRGLLAPDEFLPLAEQTGLMRPLTLAVLDLALAQAQRWRATGHDLTVAVNLSVTNLLDIDLPMDVGRLLDRHDLPAAALTLEITESVLMADSVRAKTVVTALHRLGVGLSIDDYGTGYSSLAYLHDLDVDELKLDRIFVSRLAADPRSAAIVRSTVELAHSLGLRIVAEGVEDAATLHTLTRYGCDITQGFHHSRPLPAGQLTRWLANRAEPAVLIPAPSDHLRVVGGNV